MRQIIKSGGQSLLRKGRMKMERKETISAPRSNPRSERRKRGEKVSKETTKEKDEGGEKKRTEICYEALLFKVNK